MFYYAKLITGDEIQLTEEEYKEIPKSKNFFGVSSGEIVIKIENIAVLYSSEIENEEEN